MKYRRFEELPVWKDAIDLKLAMDVLCQRLSGQGMWNWIDQIDRAALSMSNNIAEGFERGTTSELLMFLYIARGSAGEVRSMLQYAMRRPDLENLKSEISDLIKKSESISRQLRGWANSLQNSEIKGQRYLTEQSKRSYDQRQRSDAFWDKIRREHEERLSTIVQRQTGTSGQAEGTDARTESDADSGD